MSGSQRVEPIEMLAPASPEWAPRRRFSSNRSPRRKIQPSMRSPHGRIPVRRNDRRESAGRARDDVPSGRWTSRMDGVLRRGDQEYALGPDDDEDCGLVTSASGWVIAGPDGKRTTKLDGARHVCDRRGVTYMLPLGLIKATWPHVLGVSVVRLRPGGLRDRASHAESHHAGSALLGRQLSDSRSDWRGDSRTRDWSLHRHPRPVPSFKTLRVDRLDRHDRPAAIRSAWRTV